MNFLDQLDEVWRETLESDPETKNEKSTSSRTGWKLRLLAFLKRSK